MFKNKYFIIGLILFILIAIVGTGYVAFRQKAIIASIQPITLEYWGVWERPEDINLLTPSYTQRHPLITVNYRIFRAEEYKQKLLEAWAVDQGPDVFMIPNTWIREYQKHLSPMPANMAVPAQVIQGTLKKELVDVIQNYSGYNPKFIKDNFLDVVYQDVIADNQIYGLPLSVDTMVLFYNRALLHNSGIAQPAKTWSDVVDQTPKITRVNGQGEIVQSAIALGTTDNIPNSFDIVSLLMMQLGVDMETDGRVTFTGNPRTNEVIQFFLSFSQPNTTVYSWNKDMANALDMFTSGRLAYFLGYNYHAPIIKQTNPKLDWDVTPVLQPAGAGQSLTYANYWVNVVPKKSRHPEVAWQFIQEITKTDNVKPYLAQAGKTTALLGLIDEQKNDLTIGPFAQLLLQARSWYHGYNFSSAQKFFLGMVTDLAVADAVPVAIISTAGEQITQTYIKPLEQ